MEFEEYALRLNAGHFASRSKAKTKPQKRDFASSSTRTIPIRERTWTDVEPGKQSEEIDSSSSLWKSTQRLMERLNSEESKTIFRNISCIVIIGLTKSGRTALQEEEETRKDTSVVLMLRDKKFFTSELSKVIQDAVSLILLYRTMPLFRTVSSSTFIMSDVQSIYIPSSIQD